LGPMKSTLTVTPPRQLRSELTNAREMTPYSVFEMGWQILRRTQPKWCSIVLLPLKNISLSSEQDLNTLRTKQQLVSHLLY
jgi:hypothetical protein